jgi:hypothetical protein
MYWRFDWIEVAKYGEMTTRRQLARHIAAIQLTVPRASERLINESAACLRAQYCTNV